MMERISWRAWLTRKARKGDRDASILLMTGGIRPYETRRTLKGQRSDGTIDEESYVYRNDAALRLGAQYRDSYAIVSEVDPGDWKPCGHGMVRVEHRDPATPVEDEDEKVLVPV